jgi:hypothetical protein
MLSWLLLGNNSVQFLHSTVLLRYFSVALFAPVRTTWVNIWYSQSKAAEIGQSWRSLIFVSPLLVTKT